MTSVLKRAGIFATFLASIAVFVVIGLPGSQNTAFAADTNGFNPENIISDGVFTNNNSMSVAQIQSFLNSKNSACLANFKTLSLNDANGDGLGDEPYGKGANEQVSAATVIWQAAQLYRINPQVILATLEKEQGLVTRGDCPSWRYNTALGYGCPDSQPCDNAAYGFTRQIDYGVWHFRGFFDDSYPVPPTVPGTKFIAYNPDGGRCGGRAITIQNRATAALYSYTPYQPNSATLAAARGQIVDCGAYGNLNFWRYFNDWFDPFSTVVNNLHMNILSTPPSTVARGQDINYVVQFKNNLPYSITLDAAGIVGRVGSATSGLNRDFGWQGPVTLAAGASQTFTFTTTAKDSGPVYMWPSVVYQGQYIQYNNWGNTMNVRQPNLSLSEPLTSSLTGTIYSGQDNTFTAKVKNNETVPIRYDSLGIPVKDKAYSNFDAAWTAAGVLSPGQEVSLSGVSRMGNAGAYTYWVANYYGGTYSTIESTKSLNVTKPTPNFSVSGLTLSSTTPALGNTMTASFTVTNNLPVAIDVDGVGIVGRYGGFNGANRDLDWKGPIRFNAGETKTFTNYSREITDVGTHYYWVGILHQGSYIQYNSWGSTVVSKAPSFSVSGLNLSSSTPAVNSDLTGSFTVTNNLSTPIDVEAVGIVGRYGGFSGTNRDIGWQNTVHFNAGETKTFTGYSRKITDLGTHYYWIGILHQGKFIQYNNWGSTVISH